MPDIRTVTERFAVAPQLQPEEVAGLAGRFTLLINNRPDGEAADQPSNAALEAAAKAAGLRYAFIPVAAPPGAEQASALRDALARADGPALAFCRSGTRSMLLWGLAEVSSGRSPAEVEALGARAGYPIGPSIRALSGAVSG